MTMAMISTREEEELNEKETEVCSKEKGDRDADPAVIDGEIWDISWHHEVRSAFHEWVSASRGRGICKSRVDRSGLGAPNSA